MKSGNGGAVWVPKAWRGEEVVVILPDKPKLNLNERIVKLVTPYLKNIIAVFVYGSYARREQSKDSDIDIMIVTSKKITVPISEGNNKQQPTIN